MLRLKKKAAEDASAATAAANAKGSSSSGAPMDTDNNDVNNSSKANGSSSSGSGGGLKLLGVGGKSGVSNAEGKSGNRKITPGEIRIQKDVSELDGGSVAKVTFPNPNDLTNFVVTVTPDSGLWKSAPYPFSFVIPALYPHEPPKVTCLKKIYHPNINLQGNVCLNILREDWKPVLDVNAVIYGLILILTEPNPDDPLNREAADLYRNDRAQFARVVARTLQGYSHAGESFERLIK